MGDLAIRVENLGKQYRISGPQSRYKTLRESLTQAAQAPFRRLASVARGHSSVVSDEIIWALKDVSFDVQRGEAVGIIGHNGAGKTTLLKILSRITKPTEGNATIRGRVSSLLEVGTGFHPELTGRENIYLNGAILGMRRAEIDRKFDEIVAFSEIERFIDTPVKHYSSGMGVRLAFAVAAHLEPEVLLVDEVLAVGDINFQKKCLGKMGSVTREEGRTVLFVSHNMAAVLNLCDTGILLKNGDVSFMGEASDVVRQYLATLDQQANTSLRERTDRKGNGLVRVVACKVSREASGDPATDIMLADEAYIVLTVQAVEPAQAFVGIQVKDSWGRLVFAFNSREGGYAPKIKRGESNIILNIPHMPFLEGEYTIDATIHSMERKPYDIIEKVSSFVMHPKDICGSGVPFTSRHGVMFVEHKWVGCGENY